MILVEKLYKQFDKRGIAGVHHLSFSMEQGEIMAIMGPNGSGKTTLLNMLSGKLKAEGGTFSSKGEVRLFPSTEAFENINVQKFLVQSVTLDIDEEKKIQLSRDLADTFEFTFQLRQYLHELSAGQKQKVLLARELINRPALFLMDEPFAHLDPFTRKDILKGLFEYIRHQGMTVIWVTHDLEEALQFSDKIALMNFGKFEQVSAPIELIRTPRNLFVAQFLGFRNFFPINFTDNKWSSLWGNLPFTPFEKADAILVVPDYAWEIHPEGISCVVKKCFPGKQRMEYQLEYGEQQIYLTKGPQHPLLKMDSKIGLKPLIEECFIIPL